MTVAPINSQLPRTRTSTRPRGSTASGSTPAAASTAARSRSILCDGKGDPNEDANCGRQAAEEGVVALVGSFTFDASQLIPILEEEKIAMFGVVLPDRRDRSSRARSRSSLGCVELRHPGRCGRQDGRRRLRGPRRGLHRDCRRRASPTLFAKDVFKFKGVRSRRRQYVTIPIDAGDYSAQVAQAIDGTDCIYGGIADSNWAACLPAMESLGGTQRLYGHQGNLNSVIAAAVPRADQDGISVNVVPEHRRADVGRLPRRARGVRRSGPRLEQPGRARHVGGIRGVRPDRQGMEGEITNARSSRRPTRTTAVDTGGMVPVLDLTTPWDGVGGAVPAHLQPHDPSTSSTARYSRSTASRWT